MQESRALKKARKEFEKNPPNVKRGIKLVRAAYEDGDAGAAYALATWYLHGKHVPKDLKKAAKFLTEAAKGNISEALYNLAVCFEDGAGVRKSDRKAYELYVRAALWGDKQSVFEVGRCLWHGIGEKRNRRFAKLWLDRAYALEAAGELVTSSRAAQLQAQSASKKRAAK